MTPALRAWRNVHLGGLATFSMGQAPPARETNTEGIGTPFYRSGEFGAQRPQLRIWTTKPLRTAAESDVLICIVGANSGEVNLGADGAIGRSVAAIKPKHGLLQRYLFYFLRSLTPELRRGAQGSAQGVITKSDLSMISVPLPAVREQERIVETLEDHLSRLDAGDTLLGRASHRVRALQLAAAAEITSGTRAALNAVADIQGGIQKQPRRSPMDNPFPFLRVANVTADGLDVSEVHQIELFPGELERYGLRVGDLLVVEGNGSASQIGRASLWDGSVPNAVHQNHLIRVRPHAVLLPEYLEAVWNSPANRAQLSRVASSSSGLHTLSVSKLSRIEIPVLPMEQQAAIVARIRAIHDMSGDLDAQLRMAIARSARLRRALLRAAFSGKLTGQASDLDHIEAAAEVFA